jgi:hypothetical protein
MNNHWPDAPAPAKSVLQTNNPLQSRFVSILRTDPFPGVELPAATKKLK